MTRPPKHRQTTELEQLLLTHEASDHQRGIEFKRLAEKLEQEKHVLLEALDLLLYGAEQAQRDGLNQPQVNGGIVLARAALTRAGYSFP
jgi:hypothetical protein